MKKQYFFSVLVLVWGSTVIYSGAKDCLGQGTYISYRPLPGSTPPPPPPPWPDI